MPASESLLPGIAARGAATDYTGALWAPLYTLDGRAAAIEAGVLDLDDAEAEVLDLLGDWATEPRQGMGDDDYRRLIAGRRVALAGTVTPGAVWRGWSTMTELTEGVLSETPSEAILVAEVDYLPTDGWVQRVGLIVDDLIPAGVAVYGLIVQPDSFHWEEDAFEDAGFSFDFRGACPAPEGP